MRFSLKTMLLATTALAVTCYSLLYATPLLGDAYYTVCLGVIGLGIVAAIQRQRERRAFWIGFCVVAVGYLWLVMPTSPRVTSGMVPPAVATADEMPEAKLLSTRLLAACYEYYCLSDKKPHRALQYQQRLVVGGMTTVYAMPRIQAGLFDSNYVAFMSTGHSTLALLLGWLGGVASRRMYRGRVIVAPATAGNAAVSNQAVTI